MIEDVERSEDGKSQEGKRSFNINKITFLMIEDMESNLLKETTYLCPLINTRVYFFLILDVVCRLMGSTRNATKPWSTPPPPRRHNHPTS